MKLVRYLLFPFALVYDLITSIRNFFFDKGIFTSTYFDIPVIAVGNLSVGGTGKTPQIEYLIKLLKGKKVAVLSRGYKRKTNGFLLLNETHSAEDVGDAPLQFYKKFNHISVAVDADRTHGIQRLINEVNPDVVLLDDAFQHRKVQAGLYVLLTKYEDLYVDDLILPTGNLRESRRGAKRADLIVITKCPESLSEKEQEKIIQKIQPKENQKVFFTNISYANQLQGDNAILIEELPVYEIVLVTGIAAPKPLLKFLEAKKVNYKHLKYPDHHKFSEADISKIKTTFNTIPTKKKLILTTEKDYVRLMDKVERLSYIEIETKFLDSEDDFNKRVLGFLSNA
jgi:tetraacyldisaccharide 4'-kinase